MIAGLAPDHGTWRAADTLAGGGPPAAWGRLAAGDAVLVWAEFPDGRRAPARASVLLPTLGLECTCVAGHVPCRHVLALLLLDLADEAPPAPAPPWAAERLAAANTPPPAPAGDDPHLPAVAAGLAELARWLRDQAGRGLAGLPTAGRRAWLSAADRLDDAYAPAAARELRALAALPGGDADWPERLLPRLGRLMLLAEAFARLDALPPGERGDALAAAGRPPGPGPDRVADTWLAAGRRQIVEAGQRETRLWLWGRASGRWALLAESGPVRRQAGYGFPCGAWLRGEVAFLPSAWPLAAVAVDGPRLAAWSDAPAAGDGAPDPLPPGGDVAAAMAGYAAARAANPWLGPYPVLLAEVFAEPTPTGWRLRDRRQRLLPLPPRFGLGWQLLALGGDRPLTVFGEWDGATLTPLSVYRDGWHDLAGWKGLP